MKDGRLVWARHPEDLKDFWASHWAGIDHRAWLKGAEGGELAPYYDRPFVKHLQRDEPVIEAGCGVGQVVLALQARGYDVVGVELSEETVNKTKRICPSCNVRAGDILALDYPADHFGAYISYGVMEHFEQGLESPLGEARRVLRPGGKLFLSVPYFSPLRQKKARRGDYDVGVDNKQGYEFYQYAFKLEEFEAALKNQGFNILEWFYYGSVKGTKDENKFFNFFFKRGLMPGFVQRLMEWNAWYLEKTAHMVMVVAEKV